MAEEPDRWAKLAITFCLCALVGLLATLVVPNLIRRHFATDCSNCSKGIADILSLGGAVESCAIERGGQYPESLEALVVPDARGLRFLARDTVPLDPWGRVYGYEPPAAGSAEFRLFSLGADGRPGGEGEDRDLDNLLIRAGKL